MSFLLRVKETRVYVILFIRGPIRANFPKKNQNMKKELTAINLKKNTLFVFKSKKGKTTSFKTYTDPTNSTATSQTVSRF